MFAPYAEILLEGAGMSRLLECARKRLSVNLAWRDHETGATICPDGGCFAERQASFPLREILRIYTSFEVHVAGRLVGRLILDLPNGGGGAPDPRLEDCLAAIRLFYSQRAAENKLRSAYRNEFVQDLLYNKIYHQEELTNRARTFRWKLEGGVVCLIVRPVSPFADSPLGAGRSGGDERGEKNGLEGASDELPSYTASLDLVQSRVRAFFPKSIFARFPDAIVFLLNLKLASAEARLAEMRDFHVRLTEVLETSLRDIAQRFGVKALAAVGGYRESPLLAHESYQEASRALMIVRSGSIPHRFVFWEQLGGNRLIATLADTEPAREFCLQMLAPLLQSGPHKDELLRTLLCMEDNNGNLRLVAKKLSLHYNTLRYRLGRINEVLGLRPDDGEQRFNLSLALRLYRVMGDGL